MDGWLIKVWGLQCYEMELFLLSFEIFKHLTRENKNMN